MAGEWKTVEEFIRALETALREEAQTIRETDLDHAGGFERGRLFMPGRESQEESLFVDRLGRVMLPGDPVYETVTAVEIVGHKQQKVTKIEPRYTGTTRVAWVCNLEPRETIDAELAQKSGNAD